MQLPEAESFSLNRASAHRSQPVLLPHDVFPWLADGAAFALLAIGLLLAGRRLAGAFERPLPAFGLVVVFVVLIAATATVRLIAMWPGLAGPHIRSQPQRRLWIVWAPRLGLLLACGALWLPQTPHVVMGVVLLLIATEEWWIGSRLPAIHDRRKPRSHNETRHQRPYPSPTPTAEPDEIALRRQGAATGATLEATRDVAVADETTAPPTPAAFDAAAATSSPADTTSADGTLPENLRQQIQRLVLGDGSTAVEGWIRVPLEPGQRTAWAHVAFCPPLPRTPRFEFTVGPEPRARVKIGQLLPYGVRFELKLVEAYDTEQFVELHFIATSPA